MVRSWFIAIAISFGVCAQAAEPPRQATIVYDVKYNGTSLAQVTEKLVHDEKTYSIEEHTKGLGLLALLGHITRTSRGTIGPDGLRPLEFTDQRTGRDTASVHFDWKDKTLTMKFKGPPRTMPMPSNAQDRLSVAFTFSFAPPGKPVTVHSADGKGISTYTYEAAGREKLETPAGVFDTLKLVKQKDSPDDKATDLWLAVNRGNLPVRLLIVDNDGTRVDQVATSIETP